MSNDVPDRPPTAILIDELSVPRNATIGVAIGLFVGAVLYIVRIFELLGPVSGTREYPILGPEGWFLMLAFVFAMSTALLVTIVLTIISGYRLNKSLQKVEE